MADGRNPSKRLTKERKSTSCRRLAPCGAQLHVETPAARPRRLQMQRQQAVGPVPSCCDGAITPDMIQDFTIGNEGAATLDTELGRRASI